MVGPLLSQSVTVANVQRDIEYEQRTDDGHERRPKSDVGATLVKASSAQNPSLWNSQSSLQPAAPIEKAKEDGATKKLEI